MGRTIKDLSTCFLTYHTLSSSFQGTILVVHPTYFCSYIPFPPFNQTFSWNPFLQLRYLLIFYAFFMSMSMDRHEAWRWIGEYQKKAKGKRRHLSPSVWFSHLQDARGCVGLEQDWAGPREACVPLERGRFLAKAIEGPTPRLQLFHGDSAWLSSSLKESDR